MRQCLCLLALFGSLMSVGGCVYRKVLLMEANVLSMTKENSGTKKELKVRDKVITAMWCFEEVKNKRDDSGQAYGLADEAIKRAQSQNKADYIVEAKVYVDSNTCGIVEGKPAN